jgi:hypothetical protein
MERRRGLRPVARDDRAAGLLAGEEVDLDVAVTSLDALAQCRSAELARDRYDPLCLNLTFRHFGRTL